MDDAEGCRSPITSLVVRSALGSCVLLGGRAEAMILRLFSLEGDTDGFFGLRSLFVFEDDIVGSEGLDTSG